MADRPTSAAIDIPIRDGRRVYRWLRGVGCRVLDLGLKGFGIFKACGVQASGGIEVGA